MANWNQPTLTTNYTNVLDEIKLRVEDAAKFLDGTGTNLPVGAKRWNSGNNSFEVLNSSNAWVPLASTYGISVERLGSSYESDFVKSVDFTPQKIMDMLLTVDSDTSGLNASTLRGNTPNTLGGVTTGSVNADPNTSTNFNILTNHANSPEPSRYWYISTKFYATRTSSSNRSQIALSYNGAPTLYYRSFYNGIWYNWVNANNTDITAILTSLSQENLQAKSYSVSENNTVKVAFPQGAELPSQPPVTTGAIKITLPVQNSSTMMSFRVIVFDYAQGKSFDILISGYNFNDGVWHRCSACIIKDGTLTGEVAVRFGRLSGKNVVYIGELNSNWSYLSCCVTDFFGSFSGTNVDDWEKGWNISLETNAFANVTNTVQAQQLGRTINGQEIIHKGMYGSGGGINADMLDGLHATSFATASQGNKADAALPASSYTAQDVLNKIKTVDGSGSGLSADNVRGYIPNTGYAGAGIAIKDAVGDVFARLFRSNFATQTSDIVNSAQILIRNSINDNYLRPVSKNVFKKFIGVFGENQSYQNVTSQRALDTNYVNNTDKTIFVFASFSRTTGYGLRLFATVDGMEFPMGDASGSPHSGTASTSFPVPPGSTYKVHATGGNRTMTKWVEFR